MRFHHALAALLFTLFCTVVHAEDRQVFRGSLVDAEGKPIVGATIDPFQFTGQSAGTVGSGAPVPPGSFEVPGGIPNGPATEAKVTLPNGKVLRSNDLRLRASDPVVLTVSGDSLVMTQSGAVIPPVVENGGRALGPIFSASRLMLDFTYYDGGALSPAFRAQDFSRLAAADFDAIEVWILWTATPGASFIDTKGNWLPGGADSLKALLDQAQSYGLYVDARVSACGLWRNDSHDSTAQKQLIRSLASRPDIAGHPGLLGLDVSNEAEGRDKGSSSGSTGWCHTSEGEFSAISTLAAQLAPSLRVTISISGPADGVYDDNHPTPSAKFYCNTVGKGAHLAFAAPHDPRSTHSGADTEAFIRSERSVLSGCGQSTLPIALVEPFRDDHTPANYRFPLSEYEKAVRGARKGGAVLWCLHHGLFKDASKPVIDQINDTQRAVITKARAWAQ